ncbi:unnamed protein product (macronuclear) [Paramecium tetraurelia]|uniref:Uncharacterized protein n=1 Tax=Paramecium tetraurelia TaxID=5888 RepID=A0E3A7_PARTE|nr:uncharacterized protein GSPATT00022947001 [Paramecium tetraurelia]CAK89774.1 unnamed protein product [Paramecium tetraurelia]|eukprot:XP_001457171.1 hypothetical protein (macronuclear) [Paramecium tetraurelia strain d4-2]
MQTYHLYSILTDSAQEYLIDKIVFNYEGFQILQKQLNQSTSVLVSGLFGSQNEIEKQLFEEIHIKPDNLELQNASKKGNLIGVRFQNKIIFCLILQLEFFQSKPIKEKAIELTLFRILQDLTDNIKICLGDEIYNQWYLGDETPFSPFIVQRQQYTYVEQGDQEIQEYKCPQNNFLQDMTQYEILLSQNQSPFFTIIQELKFNEQDFKQNYESFVQSIFKQNILKDQIFIPQILAIFYKLFTIKLKLFSQMKRSSNLF